MTNEEKLYKAAHRANKGVGGEPISTDGTFECAFILGADYQSKKACEVFNDFLNSLKEIGLVTDTDEWYKAFKKSLMEE